MCMGGGKFLKPWQVTDKIIEWIFFPIHIQHFMSDSNSENNNSQGFEIHEWIWGDVYELGKVSETMTSDR